MSPSWRRANTSHAIPPAANPRVTTSTGSQIDQPVTSGPAYGNESQRQPDTGGDNRERARTAVERREYPDRDDGGAEGYQRAVPGRCNAAEREQALAGEQ